MSGGDLSAVEREVITRLRAGDPDAADTLAALDEAARMRVISHLGETAELGPVGSELVGGEDVGADGLSSREREILAGLRLADPDAADALSALDEAARMRLIAHLGETAEPGPEPAGPVGVSGPASGVPVRSGRLGLLGWVLALAAVGIVALGGYTLYSRAGGDGGGSDDAAGTSRDVAPSGPEVASGEDEAGSAQNDGESRGGDQTAPEPVSDESLDEGLVAEEPMAEEGPLQPDAHQPDSGFIVFADDRDGDFEVFVMDADGSDVRQLTRNDHDDWAWGWFPDGTRIAFGSDRDGDYEVFVMDADGSDVRQLTRNDHDDWVGGWSPDGTRIAFGSDRDGDYEVFVMDADGSDVRQLTRNDHDDYAGGWSPDGTRIAFYSDRDGDFEVFVMDADGSDVRQLTRNDHDDWAWDWSPDGTRIAFGSARDGDYDEVFVMDADGSDVRQLTRNHHDDFVLGWSPDGTRIAFSSDRDGDYEVFVMDADGSDVRQLVHAAGADAPAPADEPEDPADSSDPIRIPLHNWSSQLVGAEVVGGILEEAGFAVEYVPSDSYGVYQSMCDGDIELVHAVWEGAFGFVFQEQVDKGCVLDFATHNAVTREEWWYPAYVEDQCPGLPDWEALNDCASIFSTAETGDKGRYLGAPAAWLKDDGERVEGLGMDFEVVNAGSAATLWAELDAVSVDETPIVLFNWTPNFIEAVYEGDFIEFPEFEDACLTDPAWGVNAELTHDCGNPADGYLKTGVGEHFPGKWPTAAAIVQRMDFTNPMLAAMAAAVDVDGQEPSEAAVGWLAANEDTWQSWISG